MLLANGKRSNRKLVGVFIIFIFIWQLSSFHWPWRYFYIHVYFPYIFSRTQYTRVLGPRFSTNIIRFWLCYGEPLMFLCRFRLFRCILLYRHFFCFIESYKTVISWFVCLSVDPSATGFAFMLFFFFFDWLIDCFTALQHYKDHFDRGQLNCPHCSWASFLRG